MQRKETVLIILWFIIFCSSYIYLKWCFGFLFLDDAYISMSHAKTWIETGVPLMSVHNPLNSTSTPLFTLLITLLSLIFGTDHRSMELEVYGLNALFDCIILFLVYTICRTLSMHKPASLLAVSACGLSLHFLVLSASGMETMVYMAIILAGVFGMIQKNPPYVWIIGPAFFAPLIRPEGMLLSMVICLHCYIQKQKLISVLYPLLATSAGFCLFVSFYYFSYGHMLPHSIIAKQAQASSTLMVTINSWIEHAFFKGPCIGGRRLILAFSVVILIASIIGVGKNVRLWKTMLLFMTWPFLYVLFFTVTKSSDPTFYWYYFPIIPSMILMICFGLSNLFSKYQNALWILLITFIPFVVFNTLSQQLPDKYRTAHKDREGRYKTVMQYLTNTTNESGTIFHNDVGVIGFFGKQKILDYHGLISKEVLPIMKKTHLGTNYFDTLISVFAPEWIFTRRFSNALPGDTIFRGKTPFVRYVHIIQFNGSTPQSDIVDLWRKM